MRTTHATGTDPIGTALINTALAAGVLFTAVAEYHLAHALGAGRLVAALLPVAIDVYVIAAIRRGRGPDIAGALAVMGAAQICAHLLEAGRIGITVPLVIAVSLLVPLVIWRVHALQEKGAGAVAAPPTAAAELPQVVLVPVPLANSPRPEPRKPLPAPKRAQTDPSAARVSPDAVTAARRLLADNPTLTGTALAKLLGTSDGYGRRVKRAAQANV